MEAVHVFFDGNGIQDALLINVRRQRQLHEDAVNIGVGVVLGHHLTAQARPSSARLPRMLCRAVPVSQNGEWRAGGQAGGARSAGAHLQKLVLLDVFRQVSRVRGDAHLFAGLPFAAHVGLRVATRANQHNRQAGHLRAQGPVGRQLTVDREVQQGACRLEPTDLACHLLQPLNVLRQLHPDLS